jgi:hypothetical protein
MKLARREMCCRARRVFEDEILEEMYLNDLFLLRVRQIRRGHVDNDPFPVRQEASPLNFDSTPVRNGTSHLEQSLEIMINGVS